jgi:BMFP domain-containing protein YqiC
VLIVDILWVEKRRFGEAISSIHAIGKVLFNLDFFRWPTRPARRECGKRGLRTKSVHWRFAVATGSAPTRIDMNEKLLSELSARLAEFAAHNPAKELEHNFRGLLSSTFARLELVTREEYDVQTQVLARAREKLAALEARVAELEARDTRGA